MYPQYMCILFLCENLFGVTIFYRSIVNWSGMGVDVCSVYVHSAICVHLFGVNGIPHIYCQLEWG